MRIGVNSRVYLQAGSGIPYYIKNLYSKLTEIDSKNSYIFFQPSDEKTIGKTLTYQTKAIGITGALFDLFFVNRLIKKANIEIFHGASFVLPLSKRAGVKYIVTIHDLAFLALRQESNDYSYFYCLFTKYGIRRSLKNADMIVADSENTKKDIIKYYGTPPSKIEVVHLGINEVFLKPVEDERIIKEKYIFSVSTNPKRKNTRSVLQALATSTKLSAINYVVAGIIPDHQKTELETEIRKLKLEKRVKIFGYASEHQLRNLYKNAELFIYPSFYEGFGFPVVEAMASGCPVITSNNSSLVELLPDKNWLVNPYNISDIQQKMETLLSLTNKEKKDLVKRNFEFAQRFTWDLTAQKMIRLFERLQHS